MKKLVLKNDGFAVVYGLAVLFIASISGVSIMYISQKDRSSASDYSKVRSAASAARAALDAFEGQCSSQPQDVLEILKKYNQNSSNKWLLGNAQDASSEQRIKSWNSKDAPSFSACIMKFDSTNYLVQVQGIGYGGVGGKKKAVGLYKLRGIGSSASWVQRDAIHLAGEGRYFDVRINVNGNVYFGADVHFNGGAIGSVINGDFKTGATDKESVFDVPVTINGNAFFQTPLRVKGTFGISIYGNSGFEKKVTIGPDLKLYGAAFVNDKISEPDPGKFDMNNNLFMHSGIQSQIEKKVKSASPAPINNNGKIDIASRLGMNTGKEPHLEAGIDHIPSNKIMKFSSLGFNNFTATQLQAKYNEAASKNQLWNDFLVIRVDTYANMSLNSSSTFDGKVIWIVDSKINCNGYWYKCGPTSNTLVYVRSGGCVDGLGSAHFFRGYVYVEGNGEMKYNWSTGNTFRGAIHQVSDKSQFQMNSGKELNITYDESVLNEIIATGVIRYPKGMSGGLVLQDTKIRPELLSIYY